MEDIKRICIDGRNYTFFCRSRGTRNGFAHDCQMVDADTWTTVGRATRQYLNRTWECWDFQSVILDAIDAAKAREYDWIKNCMMTANGWSRMTAKRREEMERGGVSVEYQTLTKLRKEIGGYHPAWTC